MRGGYDDGYQQCPCFWGRDPAALVKQVVDLLRPVKPGGRALDAGCGDGKNAVFLARHGFQVDAVDISEHAIQNATRAWPRHPRLSFEVADLLTTRFPASSYDVVLATGPLHCLASEKEIGTVLSTLKRATTCGGYNVIAVFNNRGHDFSGHAASFAPTLLSHDFYQAAYTGWELIRCSDQDLDDEHPHMAIRHHHSVTRLLARRTT